MTTIMASKTMAKNTPRVVDKMIVNNNKEGHIHQALQQTIPIKNNKGEMNNMR